ncbi:hypothetical protein VE03_08234 [Pseudogymnoascus sp. 23342-1-I1]|nr:hypothetical protein VE03_08206 [Pseudogymnoascus sp. 23342-1-I1]OBT61945.1 hypothetical protein VE03_08234 [Pseudogymnoascus sp. 23342-1-I1]
MIYGRPAVTSSVDFTFPLPEDLDDECILADRVLYLTPKGVSGMRFSIEIAKLYKILEVATRSVDFETTDGCGEALAQSVLVLDERFQRWYADVPRELKLEENEDEAAEKPLILALRANMVRILIHRPTLALSLRALSGTVDHRRADEGVKSRILQHSRGICVSTAMETVNLIGRRHEQTRRMSGTSWFNLYYLFNATLILVSHVVDTAYNTAYSNALPCLAQFDTALTMIKAMSSNHTFAQKANGMDGIGLAGNLDKMGRSMMPDGELFAGLFDFTQDLNEVYADLGSEMSARFDEQGSAVYRSVE